MTLAIPAAPTTLTAHDVHDRIMQAAAHQIATSELARAIDQAGLGDQLRALVEQIAANAANPLACDVEDVVADAVARAARTMDITTHATHTQETSP